MNRIDHCGNLIHFTKGESNKLDYEEAYRRLKKIIGARKIKGNDGMIIGGHNCICFTESPAICLTNNGELDSQYFSRYTPFGFQYTKLTIFKMGGRPVIYSTKKEAIKQNKNSEINWRYVTYNPNPQAVDYLDFTWEREWRIRKSNIPIKNDLTKLVFPNRKWIDRFIEDHEKKYHTGIDDDCEECFCKRDATIIKYSDFLNPEKYENLSGTCPNPNKFPWVLINMNEKSEK